MRQEVAATRLGEAKEGRQARADMNGVPPEGGAGSIRVLVNVLRYPRFVLACFLDSQPGIRVVARGYG